MKVKVRNWKHNNNAMILIACALVFGALNDKLISKITQLSKSGKVKYIQKMRNILTFYEELP